MIKEEAIEQRDSGILADDPAINNNNNKEPAFRIHIRKYRLLSLSCVLLLHPAVLLLL